MREAEPPLLKGRDLSALKKESAPPETDETLQQPPETSSQPGEATRTGATVESPSAIKANGNGTLSVIEESGAPQGQTDSGGINFARLYGVSVESLPHKPQCFSAEEVERCYFKSSGPQGVGELSEEGVKMYEAVKAKYLDSVPVCPVGPPASCRTFARDGGADLVGKSLMDCHPEAAREKLEEMLKTHQPNCYTIEMGGVKKLIYQTPWFDGELFGGLIEFSFPIPMEMSHFIRNSSACATVTHPSLCSDRRESCAKP